MEYSVIMSVYFREDPENLRQAIASMVQQTRRPDEFVIVCDGPLTEQLDGVLEQFQQENPGLFRLIRLPENKGLGNALNLAIEAAKNEYLARMDSDDIACPNRMAQQMAALEQEPDLDMVGGQIEEFVGTPDNIIGRREVPMEPEQIRKTLAFRSPMNHVTVTYRKSAVQAVGGYPACAMEDYYLWGSLVAAGCRIRNLDTVSVLVRVDEGLYGRRAGWKYFRQTWDLERFLLKKQLISLPRFWANVCLRFGGTMVVSGKMRQFLYQKLMRKETNSAREETE